MNRQAMNQGRQRMLREQRRQAVQRVREFKFKVWQQHGYDRAHRPSSLPKDRDFEVAREAATR